MSDKNNIFIIFGIVLIFLGWFNIISGSVGFVLAQDVLVLTFGLESMTFEQFVVTDTSTQISMLIRVGIGFLFLFVGNSFVFSATSGRFLHPRMEDCKDCIQKLNRNGNN